MQHYPAFFKQDELRAGKSEAILQEEDSAFSYIPPLGEQFLGSPLIHSDDAAGRKVWKCMRVSFANSAVKKSPLAQCKYFASAAWTC